MSDHAHGASERGGWGLRIHYRAGGSYLNCYSGGDVVAYSTKAAAQREAKNIMRGQGASRSRMYAKVTVEKVAKGAWEPSEYDQAMLDLIKYALPLAKLGNVKAIQAVNRAKRLFPDIAPLSVRALLSADSGGDDGT